eukprot:gene17393-4304_t
MWALKMAARKMWALKMPARKMWPPAESCASTAGGQGILRKGCRVPSAQLMPRKL